MRLMNKTSRWLGSFVAVSLFIRLVVNGFGSCFKDAPQTQEPNSPERKSNYGHLLRGTRRERAKAEGRLSAFDGLRCRMGGRSGGRAAAARRQPVNYRNTRHQTAIEAGAFDDGILALLAQGQRSVAGRRLRHRFDRLSGAILAAEVQAPPGFSAERRAD